MSPMYMYQNFGCHANQISNLSNQMELQWTTKLLIKYFSIISI
jgi:hypothetical protein